MKSILLFSLIAVTLLAARDATAGEKQAGGHAAKLVRHAGYGFGIAAGVVVTAGLAVSKKWNAPLTDETGSPRTIQVKGFTYGLKQRHAPVVGPRILAKAEKVRGTNAVSRMWKTFLTGVGNGASAAPGAEAKLEAGFMRDLYGAP